MSETPATPTEPDPETVHAPPTAPPGGGPILTLGGAQRATGAARTTIRRRLEAGQILGARRTPEGGWEIPVSGLIAAGLIPKVSPPDPPAESTVSPPTSGSTDPTSSTEAEELRARLTATEAELERTRAEVASVREMVGVYAHSLEAMREALETMGRAIGPGTTPPPASSGGSSTSSSPDPDSARRSWWRRGGA
jgi:hypothetical protein